MTPFLPVCAVASQSFFIRCFVVVLGLGSNIGDRQAYLASALAKLAPLLGDMRFSRVLESKALLPGGAEPSVGSPFLNMAVRGDTRLEPLALLQAIKAIERDLGRVARGVWCAREIDIDILAMDGVVLQSEGLNVPHHELLHRDFALIPLADVAPEWRYPVAGEFFGMTAEDIVTAKGYALGADLRETGIDFHG
jgi:2-amino-4-hydroxy-6-hydroxymethyldihydropteridine diphosphokinase